MADKFAQSKGAISRTNMLGFDPKTLVIVTDKADPLYDPRVEYPVPDWMVDSIIEHGGVKVPVLVSRDGTNPDGSPLIKVVDGRQRVRACIEANKRQKKAGKEPFEVPAVFQTADENRLADLVIVTNEHRIADTPSVRAAKMAQMHTRGRSNVDIAKAFRVTPQTVAAYLKLANASAFVQKAVDAGTVPLSTVAKLADLPRAEQAEAARKMIAEGTTRGQAAKEAAAEAAGPRPKKPQPPRERIENKRQDLSPIAAWGPEEVALVQKALDHAQSKCSELDSEDFDAGVLQGITDVWLAIANGKDGAKKLAETIYKATNALLESEGIETEEDEEG